MEEPTSRVMREGAAWNKLIGSSAFRPRIQPMISRKEPRVNSRRCRPPQPWAPLPTGSGVRPSSTLWLKIPKLALVRDAHRYSNNCITSGSATIHSELGRRVSRKRLN